MACADAWYALLQAALVVSASSSPRSCRSCVSRVIHNRTSDIAASGVLGRRMIRGMALPVFCLCAHVVANPVLSGWGVRVGVVAPTDPDQRAALVELYIATNGSTWSNGKAGWQNHATGSDPCDNSWSGVTCSGSSGSGNRNV
jgi:hypothetical protein